MRYHCGYPMAVFVLSLLSSSAYGTHNLLEPFFGIDFQQSKRPFDGNMGNAFLKDSAFQYDIYGGTCLGDYFGFQLGYFANKKQSSLSTVNAGEWVMGTLLTRSEPVETHYTQVKMKGPHFDLLAFIPISTCPAIEAILGLGLAYGKLTLQDAIIEEDGEYVPIPLERLYDVKKPFGRALIGAQGLIYGNVGLRVMLAWENTGVFSDLHASNLPYDARYVSLKNSWVYGAGVYANISK